MFERLEKPYQELPQGTQLEEETRKPPSSRARYVELDGLRGIAILYVVVTHIALIWTLNTGTHLTVPLWRVDLTDFLLFFGYLWIALFFLLSGYLLTWAEEKRKRRGSYSILNYAKRRALRFLPAYYVAIAVVILVWPIILPEWLRDNPAFDVSFGGVVSHLTFLHSFVPFYPTSLDPAWWMLTSEIVFSAMLPFLVLKFRKFSQRAAILALLLLVSLVTRLLQSYDVFSLLPLFSDNLLGQNRMYFFPTTLLYLFLFGVLFRMMIERHTDAGREPGYRQLFVASVLTVVPVALLLAFLYFGMSYQNILHHPTGMIAEAMAILVFASILLGSPILKPVLKWGPLVLLGEISYSLYLLHHTVLFTMDHYLPMDIRPTLAAWLPNQGELAVWAAFSAYLFSVVAVAVAVGYLSYRYVESPFLRRKLKK